MKCFTFDFTNGVLFSSLCFSSKFNLYTIFPSKNTYDIYLSMNFLLRNRFCTCNFMHRGSGHKNCAQDILPVSLNEKKKLHSLSERLLHLVCFSPILPTPGTDGLNSQLIYLFLEVSLVFPKPHASTQHTSVARSRGVREPQQLSVPSCTTVARSVGNHDYCALQVENCTVQKSDLRKYRTPARTGKLNLNYVVQPRSL